MQLTADWRCNATGWDFYLKQSDIEDNNLHWQGNGSLRIPVKGSPYINLQGKFNAKNVALASTYLPYRHINPKLLVWLRQAFLAGAVTSGTLDFKAPK